MEDSTTTVGRYLRQKRKALNLTQPDLALKAGVGLRFVRDLEQGKTTLRMDKVNQVLRLFGQELGPTPIDRQQLSE
jgi:y4mF family transcriptional regulator